MNNKEFLKDFEENKIDLSEVLDVAKKTLNDEITEEEYKRMSDRIKVRFYLPINSKKHLMFTLFEEFDYPEDEYKKIIQLEINKFWLCFSRYTNVEIKNDELCNEENYDILMQTFGSMILTLIKEDYNRLTDMINQFMDFSNLLLSLGQIEKISLEDVKELENSISGILEKPGTKEFISDLLAYNTSKEEKVLIDLIKKESLEVAKENE